MRHIIKPLLRFSWFLLGGIFFYFLYTLYIIWYFRLPQSETFYFGQSVDILSETYFRYNTPWDYLIKRNTYDKFNN